MLTENASKEPVYFIGPSSLDLPGSTASCKRSLSTLQGAVIVAVSVATGGMVNVFGGRRKTVVWGKLGC